MHDSPREIGLESHKERDPRRAARFAEKNINADITRELAARGIDKAED